MVITPRHAEDRSSEITALRSELGTLRDEVHPAIGGLQWTTACSLLSDIGLPVTARHAALPHPAYAERHDKARNRIRNSCSKHLLGFFNLVPRKQRR